MAPESPIERVLAAVDALDANALAGMMAADGIVLTVDGQRARGREAVERIISTFLGGLRSTEHRITAQWHVDDVWIAELNASYELPDHLQVPDLPRVVVLREGDDGISDLRFYGAHERPVTEHRTGDVGYWVRNHWIPPL